jgi:hypothetical protein
MLSPCVPVPHIFSPAQEHSPEFPVFENNDYSIANTIQGLGSHQLNALCDTHDGLTIDIQTEDADSYFVIQRGVEGEWMEKRWEAHGGIESISAIGVRYYGEIDNSYVFIGQTSGDIYESDSTHQSVRVVSDNINTYLQGHIDQDSPLLATLP